MASATASRKLAFASDAALEALVYGGSGPGDAVPWDVVAERLGELLQFLFSALQALVGEVQHLLPGVARLARGAALPAVAVVAALVFLCCCCCSGVCRRRRGPNGEEVITAAGGGDGPVVRYRRGGGWIFSMHPNKPVVC